jgi:adenine-specific DNA-methyltransferase
MEDLQSNLIAAQDGIFLQFSGRESARAFVRAPRVLLEVPELGDPEGSPENLIIEGDNLDAMSALLAQYAGGIDVVIADPPYGGDRTDMRYRDDSTGWLNAMLPTFHLVQSLLAETGVVFVHIDDDQLFSLGLLLDDIFGRRNRLGIIVWKSASDNNPTQIAVEHEYILCYARNREALPSAWHGFDDATRELMLAQYRELAAAETDDEHLSSKWARFVRIHRDEIGGLDHYTHADRIAPYRLGDLGNPGKEGYRYEVLRPDGTAARAPIRGWRCPVTTMEGYISAGRLDFGRDPDAVPQYKRYLTDASESVLRGIVEYSGQTAAAEIARLFPESPHLFKWPKPSELEEYLLSFVADREALILDPFGGSGTTAHAVMRLNSRDGGTRRFILIERGNQAEGDEYAVELTAQRVRRARSVDGLPGGFSFLRLGREINDAAWAKMQRDEVARVILQADPSGKGRGLRRHEGRYVIGANGKRQAVCLCWGGRDAGRVTAEKLRAMYAEVSELGLTLPMRVYGLTCDIADIDDFVFLQLPDEVKMLLGLDQKGAAI